MEKPKLKFTAKPKDAIIFLIFCIFLLYLVAIGVLNLYYLANENTLWGLNPFPAFGKKFLVSTLFLYLCALIGVFMSSSGYFFDREKGFGFGKKKDKDESGWSRWMKDDEMKKAYNVKKITLKSEDYEHSGIPIIINDKEAYVDDGENHSLIIGASGSGKTWTIIDPLVKILGKGGESMVITDPKGEIYEHNANLLRERGYNVVLVNFRDPEMGSAWNPLSLPYRYYKDGKEDKAMELLEDLGLNILVDSNNQDPFWQKSAADYFTGLALGLFEDANSEDEVNLNSINAMSTFGEERRGASKYDKEYFKLKGELSSAYISAAATITAPADTKGGITSTFRQKIRVFSSRQKLAEMLSYTDFDVRNIGREKTAVFLKIHDEKTTYHALATIFVKQVYECLIDEAQKEENLKLKIRTNFILDEFANMPALKDVESMITASRSRNMRFNFVIQNFSQLNKVYGKEVAETIKGNCGNMFYLITTEYSALEEISKLLGDIKPKKPKDGEPQPPIRPLVTVSDLQQMKQFEMIIKRWRNQPYKTKHTPSFKITNGGGWGYEEKLSGYEKREERPIKTFDMKAFVDEKLQDTPMGGMPGMGGNPFMPSFGGPQVRPGMGASPFGAGTPSPFGIPSPTSPNPSLNGTPSSSNVDDLIKKIDAQIAKLEEEEKQEKEKLKQQGGVKDSKQEVNEFEKLINKKYEDFKNGESMIQENKIPTTPVSQIGQMTGNGINGMNTNPLNTPRMQSFPQNMNTGFAGGMPGMDPQGQAINVDELIKKIDEQIAKLEKEEEEERKAQEKVNNKPIDLDTNKEKEPDDLSDFFNMVNALSKSDDLIDSKQKIDNTADMFKDSFNPSMDVNTIPSNNPSVEIPNPVIPTESVEKVNVASDIPKVVKDATIVNEIPTEKKNEDLISSDKLKFSSPFGGSIDELMKPNSEPVVSNSNINNNDNFIREDKELKEVIDTNNIEKPKINVDADSIIVNQNVTDDQFFDDFFGD